MRQVFIWLARLYAVLIFAYAAVGVQQTWYLGAVDEMHRHIYESEFNWEVSAHDALLLSTSALVILVLSIWASSPKTASTPLR